MANVLLTSYCNQKCPYCFARKMMGRRNGNMPPAKFKKAVDFLTRSREQRVGLIGGEPTLHPQFFELLDYALGKDLNVRLFTNGLMSRSLARRLGGYDPDRVEVLLNLNERQAYSPRQIAVLEATCEHLNRKTSLGFTVYKVEFSLAFHREMILRHGLKRSLRLGLASPVVGSGRPDFFGRADFARLGRRIVAACTELEKDDILVGFDCGFRMCMFTAGQLGVLARKSRGFKSMCGPVIDIDLNLNVHHCFPLTGVLERPLGGLRNLRSAADAYRRAFEALRVLGNRGRCLTCKYLKRGQCRGGCLGRTIAEDPGLLEKVRAVAGKAETA